MTTRAWGKFQPYGATSPTWVRMDTIISVHVTSNETVTICTSTEAHHLVVDDSHAFEHRLMRDLSSITQRTRALTDYTGAVK
jgi:hypothetical protein